jgi:hypothetical protein
MFWCYSLLNQFALAILFQGQIQLHGMRQQSRRHLSTQPQVLHDRMSCSSLDDAVCMLHATAVSITQTPLLSTP